MKGSLGNTRVSSQKQSTTMGDNAIARCKLRSEKHLASLFAYRKHAAPDRRDVARKSSSLHR